MLSSVAYGIGILCFEQKILAKIQLSVICVHIVDFCWPDHIFIGGHQACPAFCICLVHLFIYLFSYLFIFINYLGWYNPAIHC